MIKALVYDFDGTLTQDVIPEFKIIELSGMQGGTKNPAYFEGVHARAKREGIDPCEAMVLEIFDIARSAGYELTDVNIGIGASERIYNPGVPEFLEDFQKCGIEHYLLSSGSQAYLRQTQIAPFFTDIYATTLNYDTNGRAMRIKRLMTPAEKAVALQEIAERVNGDHNNFEGIIYIGDGPTDVDAMEYIKQHGGGSVLVTHDTSDSESVIFNQDAIDLITPADFRPNSELVSYLKSQL